MRLAIKSNSDSMQIREALVTFFEMRGSPRPEQDARETISRVAHQLGNAQKTVPSSYYHLTARSLLFEKYKKQ